MLHSIVRHSLIEFAACNPDGPFCPEHTGCISVGVLMNFPVALAAESDQVVLGILALMAPKSLDGRDEA